MSVVGKEGISPALENKLEKHWNEKARKILEGKKIISVRYMSNQDNRPVSFKLDTGEVVVVQSDDEGNNGGSLCVIKKGKIEILPTI
jgi:aspartyl/asparaginyl beta-hydroxylase (cupin superfamily)